MKEFKPHHINASAADLAGNANIGRYIFLTGSEERAKAISSHFNNLKVKNHPRQHHLYLGNLVTHSQSIEVAAISTGMGGPSIDIIVNELILLGAKRFLRVGTAGSLQANQIKVGDIVIATAAVRDDKASWDYIYREYPAVGSLEYLIAAGRAVKTKSFKTHCHFGIVHSKSSLYARENDHSFIEENNQYMHSMKMAGVCATEMETAQLFTLSTLMTSRFANLAATPILSGALLAIIGDRSSFSNNKKKIAAAIDSVIGLGIETTYQMYLIDREKNNLFS